MQLTDAERLILRGILANNQMLQAMDHRKRHMMSLPLEMKVEDDAASVHADISAVLGDT